VKILKIFSTSWQQKSPKHQSVKNPTAGSWRAGTFSRRRRPYLMHNNELAGMSSFHALPFLVKSYANHPENQSVCLFTFECHGIKLSARFF
jgi:hypothetical protein